MNKTFRISLGIFFYLITLGIPETRAQSVSATIKIDLKSFLSIALSEKKEGNLSVQQQNYTPLEITSIGPYQLEIRSSNDQELSSISIPEISDNSLTMITVRRCSSAIDQNAYSTNTISKIGGTFNIGIVEHRAAEKPLIISVTPL
ncbi:MULTISPECIES: hypothetical protein [Sphingobacterium]|uniref:hypothetical protein n=1 Tax=Sphingobacterium TaxID=28453 RepID=UPI0010512A82|nr:MULTISPECIES: hypothetical protein [Sphingobacterium]MCW2262125.1 hypothetical protein [Sphingobacterium kitahiroshimense]TCR13128.1 hypothetical protein EDF67_102542 [Sphingobacterium sp. JUb78]